jgi:hypothetical protein
VSDPALPPTPAWIRRSDGQLVPFEPHLISQSLFAATEDLGRPNAFLARELTDGVVHFFVQESGEAVPTTEQLAELIEKVVRELGQPALAKAYADRRRQGATTLSQAAPQIVWESRFPIEVSPHEVARAGLSEYSLQAVYSPDLASAHREGLLVLTGLDQPACLRGYVVDGWGQQGLSAAELHRLLLEATPRAGTQILVDSPERWFEDGSPDAAQRFWQTVTCHAELSDRLFLIHLNAPAPQERGGQSPLFAGDSASVGAASSAWAESFLMDGPSNVELIWHVSKVANDMPAWFAAYSARPDLWPSLRFFFQQQRKSVSLADGLKRGHAGVLGLVGLNLPALAALPAIDGDATRFLTKLPSLARMGVAAGVQRRHHLRRQPALQTGFVTERAPWLVSPIGLDATVQMPLGVGMTANAAALDFAVKIVATLKTSLEQEASRAHLEVAMEGTADETGLPWGLTPWAAGTTLEHQVEAASALHRVAASGTASLFVSSASSPSLLWQAVLIAGKSAIQSLRFVKD